MNAITRTDSHTIRVDIAEARLIDAMIMPFVRHGGLFIERAQLGGQVFDLGAEATLIVRILDADEQMTVAARVIWIMPSDAQRQAGIGVQFVGNNALEMRQRLLTLAATPVASRG